MVAAVRTALANHAEGDVLVFLPGAGEIRRAQSQLEETRDAEMARLRQTRSGRVQLALRAADYRGVLESLTRDDLAALVPAAYAHAAEHPELYSLPPVRSADELTAELEEEWAGLRQTPPLGPPH